MQTMKHKSRLAGWKKKSHFMSNRRPKEHFLKREDEFTDGGVEEKSAKRGNLSGETTIHQGATSSLKREGNISTAGGGTVGEKKGEAKEQCHVSMTPNVCLSRSRRGCINAWVG